MAIIKTPAAVDSPYQSTAGPVPVVLQTTVAADTVLPTVAAAATIAKVAPAATDSPYAVVDSVPTVLRASAAGDTVIANVAAATTSTATTTAANVSYYATGDEGIAGLANYGRVFAGANVYVTLEQPQYNTYYPTITGNSTVAGSNSQIQFNNNGSFGGSANLTFDGANITVGGNITSAYLFGNGSQLVGLPASYSNANVVALLAAFGSNTISTTGNVTVGNILPAGYVSAVGNVRGANINTDGAVSAVGNITGNYFVGNGSLLTSLTGANVTGTVANATYAVSAGSATSATTAGTVTTAAQPNITSVGTLSSVSVSGNINGGTVNGNGVGLTNLTGANVTGTVANATFAVSAGSATSATTAGTVTTAAQPNITSVGTLSSLTVTGNISTTANIAGGFFIGNGSQLTGLPAGYTDSNVTTLLAALGSNVISGTGNITTTANVTGGNILTSGLISATGNITGGNILALLANITNLTSTNFTVENIFAARPSNVVNITAGGNNNLVVSNVLVQVQNVPLSVVGNVTGGNILTAGIVSATGNVSGNFFIGNGSQLTGIAASYGNANVATFLAAYGSNTISTTGNITGNYFNGNIQGTIGDILNVTSTNLTVTNISAPNPGNAVNIGAGGNNNLVVSNVLVQVQNVPLSVVGNVTGGNVLTAGLISATGNVSGNFFIGNGSQLTGLPATYGNANVATFLAAYGSNTISTSGNVTAGNIIGNISITGNVQGTTANVTLVAGAYSTVFDNTGNATFANGTVSLTTLSAVGNVSAGNLNITGNIVDSGALSIITGSNGNIVLAPNGTGIVTASGAVSAVGNVTGGNILTGGLISATGNITAGNLSVTGNVIGTIGFTGASITINNAPGGSEGAEIQWALPSPANTVLNTSLVQDVFQNGMRFFESGGNSRGLYMDLGNVPNGAGTAVGYRDIPQVAFTANATIATTDAGRHYYSTLSTGNVLTIANNASQGFQVGAAISIINQGTGNITVAQGSGVTLYLAGNATSGNRTIATFGMATIIKVATDTWFINGTGVT